MLGITLAPKTAVKLHSGERDNQNYLNPELFKPIIDYVNGTVVECNTAYDGARNMTEKHKKLISEHGWDKYFNFDLLDAEGPDFVVPIKNDAILDKNILGKDITKYNSMLVFSHFKGHPMGGFGGALKQLSIGCASSAGKTYIHTAGKATNQRNLWPNVAKQNDFLDAIAGASKTVVDMFKGNIAFINVMANMSVNCDCCAVAEDPCLKDMGILASLDPVAIDKACLDLVYNSTDPGKNHFIERVESRNGARILDTASRLQVGNKEYELIEVE